jgi:hypothetical protein
VSHPTPWRIEHRSVPLADTGDYDDLMQILSADGEEVVQWWNASDEEEAVAERIVQTMNAHETECWQPIETAPKGGKWVLLWWPYVTDAAFAGYETGGKWFAAPTGDSWTGAPGPTHWMPLPLHLKSTVTTNSAPPAALSLPSEPSPSSGSSAGGADPKETA